MSVRCQMNCLGPEETKTKLYFTAFSSLGGQCQVPLLPLMAVVSDSV